jgi:hypothetical protein
MAEGYQLRELHDSYVWEVNAAVGEDRFDLVCQLADDYMDRALRLMTAGESPSCGVPDCAVCARSHETSPPPHGRRFGFRRRRSA